MRRVIKRGKLTAIAGGLDREEVRVAYWLLGPSDAGYGDGLALDVYVGDIDSPDELRFDVSELARAIAPRV